MTVSPASIGSYLQKKKLPPKPTGNGLQPQVPGQMHILPVGNPVPMYNTQGQVLPKPNQPVPKPTGVIPQKPQNPSYRDVTTKPDGSTFYDNPYNAGQTGQQPTTDRFRFDAQYAPLYRDLDTQQVNMMADYQGMLSGLENQFATGQNQVRKEGEDAIQSLRQRMADQGIVRSGIHVGAQGNENERMLSNLNDLSSGRASGISDLETQLSRALGGLNSQREGLLFDQGRSELQARLGEDQRRSEAEAQQRLLDYIRGQQNPGAQQGPNGMSQQDIVRGLFSSFGVPLNYGARQGESPTDRIARIANELVGGRTKENLMQSLARLATQRGSR